MDTPQKPTKVRSAEAARQIGVSESQLKVLRKRREIGFQKVGKLVWFYQTELDSYNEIKKQPRLGI
jgi:excisionase family DNA binding protein